MRSYCRTTRMVVDNCQCELCVAERSYNANVRKFTHAPVLTEPVQGMQLTFPMTLRRVHVQIMCTMQPDKSFKDHVVCDPKTGEVLEWTLNTEEMARIHWVAQLYIESAFEEG